MIALIADADELPPAARVWGRENRVLPAAEREALCWLTLGRLLGWDVEVAYDVGELADAPIVIAARDLTDEESEALEARAEAGALVITRAAPGEERTVSGALRWSGPGEARDWEVWPEVSVRGSDPKDPAASKRRDRSGLTPWAWLGDTPLVVARPVGRGHVATLTAHPAELADAAPSGTGLLKHLLTQAAPAPLAWLDLEGWVIVRLDDPGSSSSVHLDDWAHRGLRPEEWAAVTDSLAEREARITIGYVPGWVDDGDPGRGELLVSGEPAERRPGAVHPSPLVSYRSRNGDADHDHPAELAALAALRERGAGSLEPHGYTHVRPVFADGADDPYAAWAAAPDRHTEVSWFRELEGLETPPEGGDPVLHGPAMLAEHAGADPVALCCPGFACSPAATESAVALLRLVSAETLAIRDGERLAWCDHVRNPFIDGAAGPWLEAGVPAVAWLHDRDLVNEGTGWLGERLDEWSAHGARRFADLRELAAALDQRVTFADGAARVESRSGIEPVRELPIATREG